MRIRRRGVDALGAFTTTQGTCGVCHKNKVIVVRYDEPKWHELAYKMLTWSDLREYTILGRAYTYIRAKGSVGVTCGCYSKLHRQLTHIADNIARKPNYQEPVVRNRV